MAKQVLVDITDLAALSDLVCQRDETKLVTPENINACHKLIVKMAGDQVDEIYAPDDGSSKTDAVSLTIEEVSSAVISSDNYNLDLDKEGIAQIVEIMLKKIGLLALVRVKVSIDLGNRYSMIFSVLPNSEVRNGR